MKERKNIRSKHLRFQSPVSLDESVREELAVMLNVTVATSLDLYSQVKQAHWNIRGTQFYGRHIMFDQLATHLQEWLDLVAERAGTLGAYVYGTVRDASTESAIAPYDTNAVDGQAHVRVLLDRYTHFGSHLRNCIERSDGLGDPATSDLYTELLRGAELDGWFLQSHVDPAASHLVSAKDASEQSSVTKSMDDQKAKNTSAKSKNHGHATRSN